MHPNRCSHTAPPATCAYRQGDTPCTRPVRYIVRYGYEGRCTAVCARHLVYVGNAGPHVVERDLVTLEGDRHDP